MGRTLGFIAIVFVLSGCTERGPLYPLDQTSAQAGSPVVEFTRRGLGSGPVTVTMPDGEILHGEYRVTENAAVGMAFAGGRMATAVGYGSGRPVVVQATGDRGTVMTCEGTADIGGHGSGICETRGNHYRMMF
jgi:hypothetical protein